MKKCTIYDFETLGQDPEDSVVLSLAALNYDEDRFGVNSYGYEELLDEVVQIKFDVQEQVTKYKRTINKDTLTWWKGQSEEARKVLIPGPGDVSIDKLHEFMLALEPGSSKKVYTRGNTFDPMFLRSVIRQTGFEDPFKWWTIRDTRSMIDGLAFGNNISDKFIPPQYKDVFVPHAADHDVVMDVMRMQTLVEAVI